MDKKVYEFIAAQTGEKIEEWRTCPNCGQEFAITDKDLEFYKKISPVFNGTKYEIPAPTLCPDCRQQRRFLHENERKLYKRKCDLTGKTIISTYSPDSEYKVYGQNERRSDKRNPMDYWINFDFTKTFFEQFDELLKNVPALSLIVLNSENADYNNLCVSLKNTYLTFNTLELQNSLYSNEISFWNSISDCSYSRDLEECYECISCHSSYKLFYSQNCYSCNDSYFMFDCIWCNNCIWCYNLNNKEYCIFNKQYTKEEYESQKKDLLSRQKFIIQKLKELKKDIIITDFNKNSENSFWYNLVNCHDIQNSFDNSDCEKSKNIFNSKNITNSYDYNWWAWPSALSYEMILTLECYNCLYSILSSWRNLIYCSSCFGNSNLFGCVWLRNKEYCIFNKQYTKEEYEQLVPKIIEHMKNTWERWEFFPASITPFGYNETVANEYFPLSRDEALKQWYKRQDKEYPINVPDWIELVRAQDLPDNIHDLDDEILKKAIVCEVSGKLFRIVKPELDFYCKHNLPLPHKHPDVRHLERLSKRAPRQLYLRTCDNCGKQVISVYPQNSEFKVYCEECYNKEIY